MFKAKSWQERNKHLEFQSVHPLLSLSLSLSYKLYTWLTRKSTSGQRHNTYNPSTNLHYAGQNPVCVCVCVCVCQNIRKRENGVQKIGVRLSSFQIMCDILLCLRFSPLCILYVIYISHIIRWRPVETFIFIGSIPYLSVLVQPRTKENKGQKKNNFIVFLGNYFSCESIIYSKLLYGSSLKRISMSM